VTASLPIAGQPITRDRSRAEPSRFARAGRGPVSAPIRVVLVDDQALFAPASAWSSTRSRI
jgi:hypothetical protein